MSGPRRRRWWISAVQALLVLAFLVLAGLALWRMAPLPVRFRVSVVRVSDGDTVVLRDRRGMVYHVRLCGIDTPELGHADGFRAALFTAEVLERARTIELEPQLGKLHLGGRRPSRDKYGRCLGWVWYVDAQGRECLLNEELLRAKQAALFEGGGKGKYAARLRRATGR